MNCKITTTKKKLVAQLIAVFFGKQGIPTTITYDFESDQYSIATSKDYFVQALVIRETDFDLNKVLTGDLSCQAVAV